ncbi:MULTISPECIES: hypothetical protein [Oerskovia]|uniref:Tetratricopeptide repeat protein n=1 Tax=Oerskovia rustica TaxID=2762237 RepID=A0ABR8RUH4_9CELL|nr:hypothetical protein [Oerskovia rustica]MBD7951441.1 hypothetical protein [Oerskovia rustica]
MSGDGRPPQAPQPPPSWGGPDAPGDRRPVHGGSPFPAPRPGTLSPQGAAMRTRRLRRRALLLLLPLPLLVAALVLGAKLVSLPVVASYASGRYDAGDYTDAAASFGLQKTMNLVDPWKAWFNTGTAAHRAGDDTAAISDLHRAYDLAEDEEPMVRCRIQVNLSISYETSGDYETIMGEDLLAQKAALEHALAARDAGEDYDQYVVDPYGTGEELDPQDLQDEAAQWFSFAERSFATAEQVRGWPGCEEQTPEEKEQNEASVQRLQDKQQRAKDAQPQEPQVPQGDSQGEEPPPENDQSEQERAEAERQEKLQQQNSEARDDEDQSRQEYQEYFGGEDPADGSGDGGGSSKNW